MGEVNWAGLGDIGNAFVQGSEAGRKAKQDAFWDNFGAQYAAGGNPAAAPGAVGQPMTLSGAAAGPATPAMAGGAAAMKMPSDPAIEQKFAQTLQSSGLTNQYGLAAMMSHVNRESGFSPSNFAGSWSDPSQSGQAGTSGGALSWRDGGGSNRFSMMKQATAGAADPVVAQAKYALVEDPQMTMRLQNAKSLDEANAILASSQRYKGWQSQGGETAARLAGANTYMGRLSTLLNGGVPTGGTQVADAVLPPARPDDLPTSTADASSSPAAPTSAGPMPAQSGLTADLPGNSGQPAPTLANPAPAAALPRMASGPLANFPLLAGASPIVPPGMAGARPAPANVETTGSVSPAAPVPAEAPAAAAAPTLDKGSLFRLTNGAKVDPSAPSTSFVGASTVLANRDLFIGPDGKAKPVGQVVASLDPSAPANTATDASPGPAPAPAAAPAAVASSDGFVPAGSGLVPGATRAYVGPGGAPGAPAAAAPAGGAPTAAAAPAKVDMTGDFPVMVKGQTKPWTRAQAASTEADSSPAEEDVEAAQAEARQKAGLDPKTGVPLSAADVRANQQQNAAATVAQSAANGGPTLPTRIAPGAPLPPAATNPADNGQTRMLIGAMLRDPATRGAGLQAMLTLSQKQNISPPFMWQGNLMQYGADGTLHQVIASKDSYTQETDKDGNIWNVNSNGQKVIALKASESATDGDKIKQQIAAREADATARGLDIKDPDVQQYIQTGKYPGGENDSRVLRQGDMLVNRKGTTVARNDSAPAIAPDTADFLAERVLAGDPKALMGLGRGKQGADDLKAIQGLVAAKAKERGMDASDLLYNAAKVAGLNAEQRTFGRQNANMAQASTEAEKMIDLAQQSSDKVFRSSFVPYNKLSQMVLSGTSDPDLKALNTNIQGVVNTYARAISPNGAPTVELRNHARDILNAADGPEAFNSALEQIRNEIKVAHESPAQAAQMLENIRQQRKVGSRTPMAQGGTGPDMPGASLTSVGKVPWSPPPGETVPDLGTGGTGGNDGGGAPPPAVAPQGQRTPLPAGYNAARVISEAQQKMQSIRSLPPEQQGPAKAAIINMLGGFGIPGTVLGN